MEDVDGKKVVVIDNVQFRGKKKIDWEKVKKYLQKYVGECYEIDETAEKIYIGGLFPNEYTGSNARLALNGVAAKAKANASKAIPEMIFAASSPTWEENKKEKHNEHAKYGWYKYIIRFTLPVYDEHDEHGENLRYNFYKAKLLVNHAANNKRYLYDVLEIKKEKGTSSPHQDV